MTDSITIRRATMTDAPVLGRLGALLVRTHHDFDPSRRGAGVGRRLLDATLAELRARGVPRAVLSTAERNETAQRLFAAAGFRRTMIEMTRELDETT